MIHHDTKYNPLSASNLTEIPACSFQIVKADCFHCGRETRFPVPPSFIDYEIVAEEYRQQLQKAVNRFDQIVRDIDVMHAGPNPVREYLDNEWKMLLLEIRKHFEK